MEGTAATTKSTATANDVSWRHGHGRGARTLHMAKNRLAANLKQNEMRQRRRPKNKMRLKRAFFALIINAKANTGAGMQTDTHIDAGALISHLTVGFN